MGDELYQQRARVALPILVRQAKIGKTMFYGDLANELGMPNPQNLNYVLGSIGKTFKNLSASKGWGEAVPPLQCLVINKATKLPGDGIGWFLARPKEYENMTRAEKSRVVEESLLRIRQYERWDDILTLFSLPGPEYNAGPLIVEASHFKGGKGESEKHRSLKNFIAANPDAVGLKMPPTNLIEFALPSGDLLDVSFGGPAGKWVGVEVKSLISPHADIMRGLFQCVKYRAVMRAVQEAEGYFPSANAILALEGSLPSNLIKLKSILGLEIIENITM